MGIVVKCAALNVVTILLASLTMITALVAITPPRWITFKIYEIPCPRHNESDPCILKSKSCQDNIPDAEHNYTGYSGVWQRCIDVSLGRNAGVAGFAGCFFIGAGNAVDGAQPKNSYLWAVRITYSLSLLSWTVGIVLLIPWFSFEKKKQEKMFKLSSASFFIMAVLIFCSLLIFASAHRDYCDSWQKNSGDSLVVERQEQGWAFQVAIVSIMLAVFSGGVSLLAAFKMELSAKDRRCNSRTPEDPWSGVGVAASLPTPAPSTSTSQFSSLTSNPNMTPSLRPTPTKDDGESNKGFDVAA